MASLRPSASQWSISLSWSTAKKRTVYWENPFLQTRVWKYGPFSIHEACVYICQASMEAICGTFMKIQLTSYIKAGTSWSDTSLTYQDQLINISLKISQDHHIWNWNLSKDSFSFTKLMSSWDKPHLKYLMEIKKSDYRSVFGRNVRNICKEAQVDSISDVYLNNIIYAPIPDDQSWRYPFVIPLWYYYKLCIICLM